MTEMVDTAHRQEGIKTAIVHMLYMFKKIEEDMSMMRKIEDISKDTNAISGDKNTTFEMKNTLTQTPQS